MRKRSSRTLKVLLTISAKPNEFTKRVLANMFNVSRDTISREIQEIRAFGIGIEHSGYPDYVYEVKGFSIEDSSKNKILGWVRKL